MTEFSIITATWNPGERFAVCLDSIRKNVVPPAEHIILDNCSDDGTAELVEKMSPDSVFISEPDKGIYDAMNKGILMAKGDFAACLNADDHYLDGALKSVAKAVIDYPEADIIHGNIMVNGREVRPARGMCSFGGARIFHPAAFIRRSLFEKIGLFNTEYRICADLDFFLRAKKAGAKFHYLDAPLTDFALGGLSTLQRKKTSQEVRKILLAHGFSPVFANGFYLSARLRAFASSILHR